MFYFIPFIVAGIGTLLLLYGLSRVSRMCTFFLSPSTMRHIGGTGLVRIGGIGMGMVFFITLLLHPAFVIDRDTAVLFLIALAMLLVGVWDDVRHLSWRMQLIAQIGAGALVAVYGLGVRMISLPFGGVVHFDSGWLIILGGVVSIVWIVGVINAVNWSDGMHGVFGGIGTIAGITLALLALRPDVYQPPIALVAIVLAGTLAGFTVCNLFGKRVIAGTSGTYFFGFMIAVLAIFAGAKIGTAFLVLIVPLIDALYVIQNRLRKGTALTAPDLTHLHHRLYARGWSQTHIIMTYYGLTLLGATLALSTQALSKVVVLALYALILLGSFFFLMRE